MAMCGPRDHKSRSTTRRGNWVRGYLWGRRFGKRVGEKEGKELFDDVPHSVGRGV